MAGARAEILVVEEDEAVRGVIVMLLNEHGFTVRQAVSGLDAVDVYTKHGPTINAILLDVGMTGMDGPATLIALRSVNPLLRCYFMTGGGGRYDDASLEAMGCACVFHKPFQTAELVRVLEQVTRDLIQAAG
jgi:two-component system, OmpR family, response regulator